MATEKVRENKKGGGQNQTKGFKTTQKINKFTKNEDLIVDNLFELIIILCSKETHIAIYELDSITLKSVSRILVAFFKSEKIQFLRKFKLLSILLEMLKKYSRDDRNPPVHENSLQNTILYVL